MGLIIDTSVLVAAERRTIQFGKLLTSLNDEPIAIAAITASELLHGCYRADDAGVRARRFAFVEALIELVPVLPFGLTEARRHAELWVELLESGKLIGPHDLLIGATAVAQGHGLLTLNAREFSRVPGLRVVRADRFVS